jgi:hypothetical protein
LITIIVIIVCGVRTTEKMAILLEAPFEIRALTDAVRAHLWVVKSWEALSSNREAMEAVSFATASEWGLERPIGNFKLLENELLQVGISLPAAGSGEPRRS